MNIVSQMLVPFEIPHKISNPCMKDAHSFYSFLCNVEILKAFTYELISSFETPLEDLSTGLYHMYFVMCYWSKLPVSFRATVLYNIMIVPVLVKYPWIKTQILDFSANMQCTEIFRKKSDFEISHNDNKNIKFIMNINSVNYFKYNIYKWAEMFIFHIYNRDIFLVIIFHERVLHHSIKMIAPMLQFSHLSNGMICQVKTANSLIHHWYVQ